MAFWLASRTHPVSLAPSEGREKVGLLHAVGNPRIQRMANRSLSLTEPGIAKPRVAPTLGLFRLAGLSETWGTSAILSGTVGGVGVGAICQEEGEEGKYHLQNNLAFKVHSGKSVISMFH